MISLADIKNSLETSEKFWIAFTGSSTTSCEWVHPNWREIVEYVLKQELTNLLGDNWKLPSWGIRCFNFGYDGATTKDILDKLPDILMVKPDLIIGMTSGNDILFGISVDQHVKNITQIIKTVTEHNTKIVWSTGVTAGKGSHKIPQVTPYAKAVMQTLHSKENVQIFDMFTLFGQFPTEQFFTFLSEAIPVEGIKEGDPDLIHPNQLGNAYIAKVMLKQIFSIEFDPEKYIETTLAGAKYPSY